MIRDIKQFKQHKIYAIAISISLLFTFFVPIGTSAIEENAHEGYIVALEDDADIQMGNAELKEIVRDEIYLADSISEIRDEIPAHNIDYIEPNYITKACDVYTPNDALYTDSKWSLDIMNVQRVWERGYFGNYKSSSDAPTVGMIDSGILGTGTNASRQHEDLNYNNLSYGLNTLNGSTATNDDYGHGTFIAGIISSIHNNNVGIAGDMPGLKIKAYKSIDSGGFGTVAQEIEAINAAINDSVDVLNISLDFRVQSKAEQDVINKASRKGIIVCASAGNRGNSKMAYPASNENTISVGSINRDSNKSSFSQYNSMVDCAAPGEDITSLNISKTNKYKISRGTSFSCPQVTALVAMCKSIDPTINHDRFMELLQTTSRDAGTPGYDTSYGWGIIDYGNMLDALVPEDNSIWSADITGISEDADYTGQAITFNNLKITMPGGAELSAGSDYTVTYYNNIKSDMGMITLQGIGSYTGRINKYFKIKGAPSSGDGGSGGGFIGGGGGGGSSTSENDTEKGDATANASAEPNKPEPTKLKAPTIKKLTVGKKSFTIKWEKVSGADGYKLQYSTTKTFKKGTRKTITISNKRINYTVKKLKPRKKYYIRMRSYRVVGGKKQYSNWSNTERERIRRLFLIRKENIDE